MQICIGYADCSASRNLTYKHHSGGFFGAAKAEFPLFDPKNTKNCRQNDTHIPFAQPLTSIWITNGMISSACNAWISNSDSFPIFMRFALQKHTTAAWMGRPTHLDLMLQSMPEENPDTRCLITFEIPLEPTYWGGGLFRQLEPHRLRYLDFSGQIGGDRGSVEKIDSGDLDWVSQKEGELIFSLCLRNPRYQRNSGLWKFTRSAAQPLWRAEHLGVTHPQRDSPD
jgi:hypothetical protein